MANARDFLFPEQTTVQKQLLIDYRLSEEFRTAYGNEVIRRYPNGTAVRTAIAAIEQIQGRTATLETDHSLIADLIYTKYVLGFLFWEYFAYGLGERTPRERTEFISEETRLRYYEKINPDDGYRKILANKWRTYLAFGSYFKRTMINITGAQDYGVFEKFCKETPRFITKPVEGSIGKGIEIIELEENQDLRVLFDNLLETYKPDKSKGRTFVCEELIISDPYFRDIHPQSVNSLRIVTYCNKGETRLVCAWLKAGKGTSIVDNGGLLAAVDLETGIVTTDARDKYDHDYPCHPDTGFRFLGAQIPRWEEVVQMAKDMAAELPEVRLIGWDIALSAEKGWQLIEGNSHGMFNVLQVATRKGMREEFETAVEWKIHRNR